MQKQEEPKQSVSKFFICIAIIEIIIAVIAATGLGINVLATTNGVADITLQNTSATIGQYYAHCAMKVEGYDFSGHREDSNDTDFERYTYKKSYHQACGNNAPSRHSSRSCQMRYAVWQWTRAFSALGIIATVIVFLTGVVLFFLGCCGEALSLCFCGKNAREDCSCCRCLFLCSAELWLLLLNILVFILFAFSWAIILGLKYAMNLDDVIADSANQALNDHKEIQKYDFDFNKLKPGHSLWPLAVASFLSLVVSLYLMFMICCNCFNCCFDRDRDREMRNGCCDYREGSPKYSNNMKQNRTKNTTIEMTEECQV
jgi:ABC-type sugar transport system permease subunit